MGNNKNTVEEVKYTWLDFEEDLKAVISGLKGQKFDAIIGIAKGGLPLAVKLSNALKTPLKIVEARSYKNKKQSELVIEQFYPMMWGKRVLLVDDICDSSDTMEAVKDKLEFHIPKVETLVIFKRAGCKFNLDHFLRIAKKGVWIKFPWE